MDVPNLYGMKGRIYNPLIKTNDPNNLDMKPNSNHNLYWSQSGSLRGWASDCVCKVDRIKKRLQGVGPSHWQTYAHALGGDRPIGTGSASKTNSELLGIKIHMIILCLLSKSTYKFRV